MAWIDDHNSTFPIQHRSLAEKHYYLNKPLHIFLAFFSLFSGLCRGAIVFIVNFLQHV